MSTTSGAMRAAVLRTRLRQAAAIMGPGLVVMLADTDVGSIITAGQSGVEFGYRLLLQQLLLVPILYVVQELTVRLGIATGRGHGELIREHFGVAWAWISLSGLAIACIGALLSELSGIAGVGELAGVPRAASLALAALALLAVALTGSYRRAERVAIAVGLFELAFLFVAWLAHPAFGSLLSQAVDIPLHDRDYLYLAAANIGAVIMPWMVFYQQSAVAEKRLRPEDLSAARLDTAVGSLITQIVMAAVLIACAATIGVQNRHVSLETVGQMSGALTPFLGAGVGRIVFGAGVLGAGMVAAIVVSLAFAWGLGEVAGFRHSLEWHPLRARWFYGVYTVAVVAAAALVWAWPDLVALNIGIQVMNALLLPLVLGFLIALAIRSLPAGFRLSRAYLAVVIGASAVTCLLGVFGALAGLGLV
ncbi:MAG: divalent metal cation transporter [Rhodospirillales bacterium]|nr:divalent metal cation transporter [Rhodospirillales bacterium]